MVYKLSHAIDLAPLVAVVSWQVIYPTGELRLVSWVMATMAVVVLVRFVALEIRSKAERVLILGSGPLASNLIEDIESARIRRYAVVGTVDDERPDAESPAGARWLGPCDRFSEIVEQVHPARIVVAVADRRDRLPLQSLLESRVRGIVVEDALEFSERLTGKIAIERSEEHTSELQSLAYLVCRLLLEKKKRIYTDKGPSVIPSPSLTSHR